MSIVNAIRDVHADDIQLGDLNNVPGVGGVHEVQVSKTHGPVSIRTAEGRFGEAVVELSCWTRLL